MRLTSSTGLVTDGEGEPEDSVGKEAGERTRGEEGEHAISTMDRVGDMFHPKSTKNLTKNRDGMLIYRILKIQGRRFCGWVMICRGYVQIEDIYLL